MPQVHNGGCICGEVRFTVTGRPLQVMVCHCTMCQRATGSAFSVEPVFLKERVEVQGQSLATYSHRSIDHVVTSMHESFCSVTGADRIPAYANGDPVLTSHRMLNFGALGIQVTADAFARLANRGLGIR